MSERSASTFRKGSFTDSHVKVLAYLNQLGVSYKAEEVVHCYGAFDGSGRPVSYKVDILVNDSRYGAGIIEVDGKSHKDFDGLGNDWGVRNFVNPPYSKKVPWIKKAIEEQRKGKLTVMLLPVDTSTNWFHDLLLPNAEIRWLRKRLIFPPNKTHAAYASMLAIFRPK